LEYRFMMRLCVFRVENFREVNINDEIGLEPYADYTLKQYLSDLAEDGKELLGVFGETHYFSDGSLQVFVSRPEPIPTERLDIETMAILLSVASAQLPPTTVYERPLVA
jgi:hypothetical protein